MIKKDTDDTKCSYAFLHFIKLINQKFNIKSVDYSQRNNTNNIDYGANPH